jgi:hypothetical protein
MSLKNSWDNFFRRSIQKISFSASSLFCRPATVLLTAGVLLIIYVVYLSLTLLLSIDPYDIFLFLNFKQITPLYSGT